MTNPTVALINSTGRSLIFAEFAMRLTAIKSGGSDSVAESDKQALGLMILFAGRQRVPKV